MHVIDYLKQYGPELLEKEYHIDIKYYPDRISLNYNQIETPKYHPIAKECRGLILALPDYKVLCRSFDRFYNYLEDQDHEKFDISKAQCFKKIDGSLINVYFDGIAWQAATRKMAFAEGPTRLSHTYRELFETTLGWPVNESFKRLGFERGWTYTFELVSPETRVVTPYSEPMIYMLNMRHTESGVDAPHSVLVGNAQKLGVPIPKIFTFSTLDSIDTAIKELPALDEGYVCYIPEKQWRIKIKNPSYLAVAHLRGNDGILSTKRLALLVCKQDQDEYLDYFPEDRIYFQPYTDAFSYMRGYVDALWHCTKSIEDRKTFALAVRGPAQHLMFAIKDGKKLPEIIEKMADTAKERMLTGFLKMVHPSVK